MMRLTRCTAVWCDYPDFEEPSYVEEATPELAVMIWQRHLREVHHVR